MLLLIYRIYLSIAGTISAPSTPTRRRKGRRRNESNILWTLYVGYGKHFSDVWITSFILSQSMSVFIDCWYWLGSTKTTRGLIYGTFWDGVRNRPAHAVMYESEIGKVPKGMELDHLCRN